jgi:hypothetical protein
MVENKKPQVPDQYYVPSVTFVVEQDGEPEQRLKNRLCEHFEQNSSLTEAFLVRVTYGTSRDLKVALCLIASNRDTELVRAAASEFAKIFGSHESLDVMFLNPKQQQQVARVAKPFYRRPLYMV